MVQDAWSGSWGWSEWSSCGLSVDGASRVVVDPDGEELVSARRTDVLVEECGVVPDRIGSTTRNPDGEPRIAASPLEGDLNECLLGASNARHPRA